MKKGVNDKLQSFFDKTGQKEFNATCYIGGKKVSESRFWKQVAKDVKGEKKKEVFYWTDEKVIS